LPSRLEAELEIWERSRVTVSAAPQPSIPQTLTK
jgi:hypothetical protein